MGKVTTDIDIDFADREGALDALMVVSASMSKDGVRRRHPTSVYFQNIPTDPIDGYAAIEYEPAADNGYFKIDFLNNSIYNGIRDEEHLDALINTPVDWDLFLIPEVVSELAHIKSHFNVVQFVKPKSIDDLAVILALIRPGKRHLIGAPRHKIDAEIWSAGNEDYTFKRAHACAYAVSIIVQLNKLFEELAPLLDDNSQHGDSSEFFS
jgi:hypothetical protein